MDCFIFTIQSATLYDFFLCGERPSSRCYGRIAALRLIVQPCDEEDWLFFRFLCNGTPVEWNWQGKTEVLGEKPVPVPLRPQLIPHGLARDRTRASAVRGRRLTAWAMLYDLQHASGLNKFRFPCIRDIAQGATSVTALEWSAAAEWGDGVGYLTWILVWPKPRSWGITKDKEGLES
jgi:hypothetical protein